MKKLFLGFLVAVFVLSTTIAYAGWVNGYTRSDGTYVRGHYRSNPDGYKWNNYGPSQNSYELISPQSRDYDGDGTSNAWDFDDDNDGILDDFDNSQYGR